MTARQHVSERAATRSPSLEFCAIHGYRRAYRVAGSGPALLLIHGIGDNSSTWDEAQTRLAERFTVIAPDLLGHGKSDKPRADYSVSAYANGMRDLLSFLGIDRATIVGHSLGGGVALQFAYQFPQCVERLVLVSSGGVAKDVNIVLRAASLPFVAESLPLLQLPGALPSARFAGGLLDKALRASGLQLDIPEALRILADLPEPTASSAFARTLRAVVDWRGQAVTMLDRWYLAEWIPVQFVWGARDRVIPVDHARLAHAAMPGSRLEVFDEAGHFPFHADPARFVRVVEEFVDATEPAEYDVERLRALLRRGARADDLAGSADMRAAVLDTIRQDGRGAS